MRARLLAFARGQGRRWTAPRLALLIAGLTAAYHVVMEVRVAGGAQPSLHQRLELTALDAKLAARGARPPERWRVAIAAVDEPSLEAFGPLPWSRRRHAEVVRALTRLGAAAIAFDMTFEQPETDPALELRRRLEAAGLRLAAMGARLPPSARAELADLLGPHARSGDEALAEALRESGRVVLGVVALSDAEARSLAAAPAEARRRLAEALEVTAPSLVRELVEDQGGGLARVRPPRGSFARGPYLRYFGLTVPTATLAAAAAGFGALNAAPDPDGVNRSLPLVLGFTGQDVLLPTLALEAVAVARDAPVEILGDPSAPLAEAARVGGDPVELGLGSRVLADWYGGFHAGGMPRLSIADLLAGRVPREAVEGRVVFVAATAIGTHDQRVTPLERAAPGVYIHATLAQNLLDGRRLARPPWIVALELSVIVLIGLLTAGVLARFGVLTRLAGGLAMVLAWGLADQLALFEAGFVVHTLLPAGQIAVTVVAFSLQGFLAERRERRRTRVAFGRYLSPRVMEQVLSDPERHLRLGGERKEATVLFSDIRGFTSISESLDPETLGRLLNRYMTPMTRRVFAHEGTLDKYMGDAVMAFWGAPIPQPDHALRACRAALGMLEDLEAVNASLEAEGLPRVSIGIGLSTGEMTIGNMGSDDFFAYTALGDRVNLGARLEGQTKSYGVSIILSEATYRAVADHMVCRELDLVRVKGKQAPERIYELLGPVDTERDLLPFVETFHAGLALFRARRFAEARSQFEAARVARGDDRCAEQYRDLAAHLELHPPPPDWDGVREATTK